MLLISLLIVIISKSHPTPNDAMTEIKKSMYVILMNCCIVAKKYPNGVLQSNGNLKNCNEKSYRVDFVSFTHIYLRHCSIDHLKGIISQIFDIVTIKANDGLWEYTAYGCYFYHNQINDFATFFQSFP